MCVMAMHMYSNVQKLSNGNGGSEINYLHLKDLLKWNKLSKKTFIPLVMSCHNSFMNGISKRSNKK